MKLWLAVAALVTVGDLQPFRESQCIHVRSASGKSGVATLMNLNPRINSWYLLSVAWSGAPAVTYHLENPSSRSRRLILDEKYPSGLVLVEGADRYPCEVFDGLEQARLAPRIYAPLCNGRIYLRNPATGHRTTLEAATAFLRDRVWGGEKIISLGHILLGDAHRETGSLEPKTRAPTGAVTGGPAPARINPQYADELLTSNNLGIGLEAPAPNGMIPGGWYAAAGNPGAYVSILRPNLISPEILSSYKTRVNALDGVEASALCYLIAFDLDRYALGYELGAEHPKVNWSAHLLDKMRDPSLPGPDGLGTIAPLIATGLVAPEFAPSTIATFTAGFKREHGAFKYGDLALMNHGTHYGFIENGVVLSRLQPGLATILMFDDDSVQMKTWIEPDSQLLPRIRHARQNGVPIVESMAPGPLVKTWGPGNWSGPEDLKLRTMRSGAAIQTNGAKRFLIYAVFTSATPSAMARVFQAYRCDYAMLLDMNALEHTYLAVYRRAGSQLFVDHLVRGMDVLEKNASGEVVPRFLGYADNRDFFYVMRRSADHGGN
jgi:hypothetical protein